MEYEYTRERSPEPNDFGLELAVHSEKAKRPDYEPRDVPPPIIYDDEYGKTVLAFSKIGQYQGYKVYDISYRHNEQQPHSMSDLLDRDFFFWWTNNTRFSTLTSDNVPMVAIDYNTLASSRHHLLSLGHEIGHTHQYGVDVDLWTVLGSGSSTELVQKLKAKYPSLSGYINDLHAVRNMNRATNSRKMQEIVRKITHKTLRGFRDEGIDSTLPKFADRMTALSKRTIPIGPTHYGDFFIPKHFQYTLPGIYLILDAMGEQMAWEFAMGLEEKGTIHPGFRSDAERSNFMAIGLETYDDKYRTTAYTDWLKK